jgi:CheY-like chemotaxis protein
MYGIHARANLHRNVEGRAMNRETSPRARRDSNASVEWPKVLVAEQDESIRAVLVETLLHDGYDVLSTASGHEAMGVLERLSLRHWSKLPVDLVVAEARMDCGSGLSLGERIRTCGWPVPMIFLTAADDVGACRVCERLQFPLLPKPVRMDRLRGLVLSLLAMRPRLAKAFPGEPPASR